MPEDGTDSLPEQIVEYLEDLREVPLPEELQESGTQDAAARLLDSSPELADLMAQEGDSPLPAQRGPHGEVELPQLGDEQAMKAKAIELLDLDMPKPKATDEEPPEPATDDPEPPLPTESPPPPGEPEPPPELAGEDQHGAMVEKINEILAYLRLRRDIETPSALMEDGDEPS